MAQSLNLQVDQGSDFLMNLTVSDDTGTAYDLSEWTVSSKMRKHHTSTTVHSFSAETVAGTTGNLNLVLPAVDSATIPSGRYVYDVILSSTSNNAVKRVLQGLATVHPRVTY